MHFKVVHDSRIGRRSNNQDRLAWGQSSEAVFLVVADGMGGHRLGEVAAQLAIDQFAHTFALEARPRLDDPRAFLQRMMLTIHETINNYASMRAISIHEAPRTTCVACVIQDCRAIWVHVGDSRLFFIRDGQLLERTQDHSLVQALLDAGEITAVDAQTHPKRNLVTSCLGGDMVPRVDLSPSYALEPGDTLALCSDGIWAHLTYILPVALSRPLDHAVPRVMDQAEQLNGPNGDNLSLLVLRWESGTATNFADAPTVPFNLSQRVIESRQPDPSNARALSDAEIMSAVENIRTNLKKKRPPETTK